MANLPSQHDKVARFLDNKKSQKVNKQKLVKHKYS